MTKKSITVLVFLIAITAIAVPRTNTRAATPRDISLKIENARFYTLATIDIDKDGHFEVLAAGQKGDHENYSGYIALFRYKNKKKDWELLAEDSFAIRLLDKPEPTRIRSLVVLPYSAPGTFRILVAGRTGGDETGSGFLRECLLKTSPLSFTATRRYIFHAHDSEYTHGYPLALYHPGQGKPVGVVYGGFSEDPAGSGDLADVRIFLPPAISQPLAENMQRPFTRLPIPLRVNALICKDFDRDGRDEIIIAGRTVIKSTEKKKKKKKQDAEEIERAALAYSVSGKDNYTILDGELPDRLRALMAADLDGDGQIEVLSAGRIDFGKQSFGRLDLWNFRDKQLVPVSRYCWTVDGATRIRALVQHPNQDGFIAVGRSQIAISGYEDPIWVGFIRRFKVNAEGIIPSTAPSYFSLGYETRIRTTILLDNQHLVTAGFIMDKKKNSTAFILLTKVK